MNVWIALLSAVLAWPAHAEIYKCRQANGKTEISNSPCSGGSNTVTVRPYDTVTEENRTHAEQSVERMQSFVEKRKAEQLADEKIERERQASERQMVAQQRVYESSGMDNCLRELAQHSIDPQRRAELEAICRAKAKNEPTVISVPITPYGAGGAGACIQNVMRLHLSPAEQNRRINQCQGIYNPAPLPLPLPAPLPPPQREPKAENKPGIFACPRGDKYCVR